MLPSLRPAHCGQAGARSNHGYSSHDMRLVKGNELKCAVGTWQGGHYRAYLGPAHLQKPDMQPFSTMLLGLLSEPQGELHIPVLPDALHQAEFPVKITFHGFWFGVNVSVGLVPDIVFGAECSGHAFFQREL